MELTNEMIKTIAELIKAAVEKKINTNVAVFCGMCPGPIIGDIRVEVIVSSQANLVAETELEKLGEGIIPLIDDATRLTWERVGEKIFLKAGYVIFYDVVEIDSRNDILLEEYNIIAGGEFGSPALYVDGKEHTCGFSFSEKCKYYYEFDMDNFRFERCLPGVEDMEMCMNCFCEENICTGNGCEKYKNPKRDCKKFNPEVFDEKFKAYIKYYKKMEGINE